MPANTTPHRRTTFLPQTQRGVSLIIALVVVVMMTVAGIAMMRQMGMGLSIAGNLAFKQNATSGSDLGIETAYAFLTDGNNQNTSTLSFDIGLTYNAVTNSYDTAPMVLSPPAHNYFSSWDVLFTADPVNWPGWASIPKVPDGKGNNVQYVIHRLCQFPNLLPTSIGQQCSNLMYTNASYALHPNTTTQVQPYPTPYYRITTRVEGPRNSVSYTQVIVMN